MRLTRKKKFNLEHASTTNEYCERYDLHSFWAIDSLNNPLKSDQINFDLLNAAVFFQSNLERDQRHLPICAYHEVLEAAAWLHSSQMKQHRFFAHENPANIQLKTLIDRVNACIPKTNLIFQLLGENLADMPLLNAGGKPFTIQKTASEVRYFSTENHEALVNYTYRDFAQTVVKEWINSPGHRKNLFNADYRLMGCGSTLCERSGVQGGPLPHRFHLEVTQNFGSLSTAFDGRQTRTKYRKQWT